MTDDAEALAKLAGQFYEGVLADDGWQAPLEGVARMMGSPQAVIIARDTALNRLQICDSFNVPQEVQAEYNAYYHQYDLALPVIDRVGLGQWYHDRRDVGEEAMRRSEFYQDFMRRHGYASIACNRVLVDGSVESNLSVQRMLDQPEYTEHEMARLAPLVPHLQRAVRIRTHLQKMAVRAGVAERAIDLLRIPLVVADATGRVLLVNTEAEAVLHRRPELAVRGGRLCARDGDGGKLDGLLRQACGVRGAAVAGGMQFWSAGQGVLQLVATPLPARVKAFHTWARPLALLLLHDTAQPATDGEALLHGLYGLTAAEARVALAIAGGATPAEAAAQLGIAVPTVRTHLKAVFLKTATQRQAELVRTLSALLAVAGREGGTYV